MYKVDKRIDDESRWRTTVRHGINDIKSLRVLWKNARRSGDKSKEKKLADEIRQRKDALKELITSRDYEWRD